MMTAPQTAPGRGTHRTPRAPRPTVCRGLGAALLVGAMSLVFIDTAAVAAPNTITVTTLTDVVNGADGVTSLREAVASTLTGDVVDFDPSLFTSGPGVLTLTAEIGLPSITINGPGKDLLTIKGSSASVAIVSYSLTADLVTFTTATAPPFAVGSWVEVHGFAGDVTGRLAVAGVDGNSFTTALTHADIASTSVSGTASGSVGAAFRAFSAYGGARTVTGLTIDSFMAERGGAFNVGGNGALTLIGVGLSNNVGYGNYCGGAIKADRGFLDIQDSTFTHNIAGCGPAIFMGDGGGTTMSISGSTFTDNIAQYGPAVDSYLPTTVTNSTFTGSVLGNGQPTPSLGLNGLGMPGSISGSTFTGSGVAVSNNSVLSISSTTIDQGAAGAGLALGETFATISNSSFSNCTRTATVGIAITASSAGWSDQCASSTGAHAVLSTLYRVSGVMTMNMATPHGFSVGDTIRVCGVQALIAAAWRFCSLTATVDSVPSAMSFTFANAGSDWGSELSPVAPISEVARAAVVFIDTPEPTPSTTTTTTSTTTVPSTTTVSSTTTAPSTTTSAPVAPTTTIAPTTSMSSTPAAPVTASSESSTTTAVPPASGGFGGNPAESAQNLTRVQGGTFDVNGWGFAPGATVQVWVHSTPMLLATLTADGQGMVSATLTVPITLPIGSHTVELLGPSPRGEITSVNLALTVLPAGAMLPTTGASVSWWYLAAVLIGLGVIAGRIARRPQRI